MEDADLDAAVATLIDGAMFNSGQCCCGIERIYVTASLYDAFVDMAVALVKTYKLGNPLDTETTLGPMANARFAAEVRAQTDEALAAGAKCRISRGSRQDDGGCYLTPQILTGRRSFHAGDARRKLWPGGGGHEGQRGRSRRLP